MRIKTGRGRLYGAAEHASIVDNRSDNPQRPRVVDTQNIASNRHRIRFKQRELIREAYIPAVGWKRRLRAPVGRSLLARARTLCIFMTRGRC